MVSPFEFEFMRNAFAAATFVAVLAGAAGYFVVLRGQTFAAHTLAQVGFPGAAAGVLAHLSPMAGLIAFCGAGALAIRATGRDAPGGGRRESAAIGALLALALATGLLFTRLYHGSGQGVYGFLFGSVLGVTRAEVVATAAAALAGVAVMVAVARPLTFASVDPVSAEARGVPVRALATAFLLVVALAVAVTVQVVGTVLVFALLVIPAACAVQMTARPAAALAASVLLALAFTWAGLAAAYESGLPAGFLITTLGFGSYAGLRGARLLAPGRRR